MEPRATRVPLGGSQEEKLLGWFLRFEYLGSLATGDVLERSDLFQRDEVRDLLFSCLLWMVATGLANDVSLLFLLQIPAH